MESSIYQAPESDVTQGSEQLAYGSVERAINGDYTFSVRDTLSEAWDKTKGTKAAIHLGYLIYFGVFIGLAMVAGVMVAMLVPGMGAQQDPGDLGFIIALQLIIQLASTAITMPMLAGLLMIGIRRSVDAPVSPSTVLQYFNKAPAMLGMAIVMTIFIMVGYMLLILPGIYLSIAYMFALPLMADKNLGVWDCMEISRKTISKRWFSFLGLLLVLGLLNLAALILTLGIGVIWTLPMSHVALGIAYRNMFGVAATTTQT